VTWRSPARTSKTLSAAIQKTGARKRIEAAQIAERNGWL